MPEHKYITDDTEISSDDSDREDSDKENSNEEILVKAINYRMYLFLYLKHFE